MLCLDTSFLVDYLNGEDYTLAFLEREAPKPFATTSLTMFELYRGALRSEAPGEDLRTVREGLDWLTVLPFDDDFAHEAAEVEDELRSSGDPVNIVYSLIGGIARAAGATMVTSDNDFAKIGGLETVDPRLED